MRLHNNSSTYLVDARAAAQAVLQCISEVSFRNTNLLTRIARHGRTRSYPFYFAYVLISFSVPLTLCGCLGGQLIGPKASAGSLQANPNSVSFGSVPLGTTTSASVSVVNSGSAAVQVSQVSLTGQSFALSGANNLPITVAAGQTLNLNVIFSPAAAGTATGELTIASDAAANGSLIVSLNGNGASANGPNPPALSSLSCANAAVTGPASEICTVALSSSAPAEGFNVSLVSNNGAVTLPAAVTVPAGGTNANFTANVATVSTSQTASLVASAAGVAKTFDLQLNAPSQAAASAPELIGLNCGNSSMTGAGTDNCTISLSAAAPSGGFAVSVASNNSAIAVPSSVEIPNGAVT